MSLEKLSKAFKSMQRIDRCRCLEGLIDDEVYIKTISAKEAQDCSPQMEIVDGKPALVEGHQIIARKIFYSLCHSDGSRYIKTEKGTDGEDFKAALDVIDSWPQKIVNSLLAEIKAINPDGLSEEDIEAGKPGKQKED